MVDVRRGDLPEVATPFASMVASDASSPLVVSLVLTGRQPRSGDCLFCENQRRKRLSTARNTMSKRKKKTSAGTAKRGVLEPSIHPKSAGIDIGAEELVCAVPPDLDQQAVKTFPTFTRDLHALRDWLTSLGVTTVAMESTGTYWIATYEILEAAGIEVCLVNARHVKGVPGKKTDVCDAQWLQQLHAAGLLRASFRPSREVVAVRQLVRHRSDLVRESSRHIHHMQKTLIEMNIKLHHVFSDLDGMSAMAIVEAILAGERDPESLWLLRDRRCRCSREEFEKALEADWQSAQLFILGQSHRAWQQTHEAIAACDEAIEDHLEQVSSESDDDLPPEEENRRKRRGKNDVGFDIRAEAYRQYGVDLSRVDGISNGTLLVLLSEIGNAEELRKNFRSAKAFSSWLGLCPDNRISGGKVLKTKTRPVVNRVSNALRLAAFGVGRSDSALGDYCRRMKAKLGKAEGITATAHKLSRVIYGMIHSKQPYDEAIAFQTHPSTRTRRLKKLRKIAHSLGMQLTAIQPESI